MNNLQENKEKQKRKQKSHAAFDIVGRIYSYISMAMIVCVFAFILVVTFGYGWGVLSLDFLLTEPNPSAMNTEAGGILTPIIGTFVLTLIGIAIAFPFALATAIYLCFYTKKGFFKTLVKSAVDILAGIPTIVIALFALVVFTLPQMGFLSSLVDTRRNSLSGTELTLKNSGSTLTTYIYYTSPAGEGNRFDVAFGAALVLIAIIILLNITATVIGKAGGTKKDG